MAISSHMAPKALTSSSVAHKYHHACCMQVPLQESCLDDMFCSEGSSQYELYSKGRGQYAHLRVAATQTMQLGRDALQQDCQTEEVSRQARRGSEADAEMQQWPLPCLPCAVNSRRCSQHKLHQQPPEQLLYFQLVTDDDMLCALLQVEQRHAGCQVPDASTSTAGKQRQGSRDAPPTSGPAEDQQQGGSLGAFLKWAAPLMNSQLAQQPGKLMNGCMYGLHNAGAAACASLGG
jgi:hypothetical protein